MIVLSPIVVMRLYVFPHEHVCSRADVREHVCSRADGRSLRCSYALDTLQVRRGGPGAAAGGLHAGVPHCGGRGQGRGRAVIAAGAARLSAVGEWHPAAHAPLRRHAAR